MSDFRIEVKSDPDASGDEARPIRIVANDVVFTRLLREGDSDPDDVVLAPPSVLAWWLVDHWWRLRWESVPPQGHTERWRLAHDLTSVGAGFAWPRLSIWGEGARVELMQRSDREGVAGPVRFLTDALVFVSGSQFEAGVDAFLTVVADPHSELTSDARALQANVRALFEERGDSSIALWRRFEAQLGYDPDDAPDAVVESLLELASRFGHSAVGEAAQAAPGPDAAETLEYEMRAAKNSGVVCSLSDSVGAIGPHLPLRGRSPWREAEDAAKALRSASNVAGPLRNPKLAALLGISRRDAFKSRAPSSKTLAYGLRVRDHAHTTERVALRSLAPHDRRFELSRALGDAIWSRDEPLGPLAHTGTERQKFQRAFAQALLCPFDELFEYLAIESHDRSLSDEDISAAAYHFGVAKSVVLTLLVNKKIVPREILEGQRDSDTPLEMEPYVGAA